MSTRVASTAEVVKAYYDYVNSGNWEAWLTLYDPNIVMEEQLAGHIEGIETLRGGVDGLKRGYSKFLMHPVHTLVQGDEACVIWHCEAANAAGVPIDAHGANWFQVRNGLITQMSNHHDSVPFKPFTDQKL